MKKLIIEIYALCLFTISKLINYFFYFSPKKLLIIRTDGIGDYILFRNFLSEIKKSNQFKNHQIYFIANPAYKDLIDKYDQQNITKLILKKPDFYQIYLKKTKKQTFESLHFLFYLWTCNFDILLQTTHSRTLEMERFTKRLNIKKAIAVESDTINFNENDISKYNTHYSKIIKPLPSHCFEFLRNKFLFENILETKIPFIKPFFEDNGKERENYIVLFPGAGTHQNHAPRRWSTENFATLIQKIMGHYPDLSVYIAGGTQEKIMAEKIIQSIETKYANRLYDYTQKTTLSELVLMIQKSKLLLTNDTSAYHIGAASDTPTLCFSNGNHYGRFNPYPIEMQANVITLYPEIINQSKEDFEKTAQKYALVSAENINAITPDFAFESVKKLLI